MASGLPCIISDHCGSSEDLGRLTPNQTYPYGNSTALAECILKRRQAEQGFVPNPEAWLNEFTYSHCLDSVAAAYSKT
jgi:hypothetical protein